jgi:hypothetical protein
MFEKSVSRWKNGTYTSIVKPDMDISATTQRIIPLMSLKLRAPSRSTKLNSYLH